jgi:hypothetical protein
MTMKDESTNSARMQSRHLITVLSRKRKVTNDKLVDAFSDKCLPTKHN